MHYCRRCVLPETHDTLMFDKHGVCSVCRQIDYKNTKINWKARNKELLSLVSRYKDKGLYDCIIPFSGGKDSTFQLWYVINKLHLKPLVVRFNHWFYRPLVDENNTRTFKKLGVDCIEFTPNWHVVRLLMLESLKRRGDFCWHCHTGIYAGVMNMALLFKTPLIVWGESLAEYASWYSYKEKEEVDEKRFNRTMNLGMTADDMLYFLKGKISERDLWMFKYPSREELVNIGCRSICLGNYIKWNTKAQVKIIKKELGWKGQLVEGIPPEYDYEKIECAMQGVRDYCKFLKRGYGRTSHLVSIDIRNNKLSRKRGLELARKYDGKKPKSLELLLKFLNLTEKEFYQIMSKHTVSPWKFDVSAIHESKALPDYAWWDQTVVKDSLKGDKES